MTEGELRKRIIDALYEQNKTRGVVYRRHVFKADADAVLAVLRPHLGLGVDDRVIRWAAEFIDRKARRMTDDRHEERAEALRLVDELRAIAGRGEGTAEGEST